MICSAYRPFSVCWLARSISPRSRLLPANSPTSAARTIRLMVMATISSMIEYPRGRVGRLSLMRRSVTRGGADGDRGGDQPAEGVAGAVRARPAGERGCCGGDHPLPRDRDLVDARRAHAEPWVSPPQLRDAAASAQHAAGVGAGALLAGTL